jgi:hypothetical protein
MSTEENDATIGRLHRKHRDAIEKRLLVVERIKQIAAALKSLADSIDNSADFEAVCKDSILQQYLDLSKIGVLVLEEQALTGEIHEYEQRLGDLGF